MTIGSACQKAALRLVGRKPSTFFGTTNQFEMEVADLANEAAADIVKGHEWQALTKIATITGDGTTAAFDKPDDYDRMCLAQDVEDGKSWFWSYTPVPDLNTWVEIQNGYRLGMAPGWWILLGNQFQFAPAPVDGAKAQYPYISNLYAKDANGTAKAAFTRDDDSFVLDENLLTLAIIWRWRAQKQLGYEEDLANSELALSRAQARDKGSRVIRQQSGIRGNVGIAWPWELG